VAFVPQSLAWTISVHPADGSFLSSWRTPVTLIEPIVTEDFSSGPLLTPGLTRRHRNECCQTRTDTAGQGHLALLVTDVGSTHAAAFKRPTPHSREHAAYEFSGLISLGCSQLRIVELDHVSSWGFDVAADCCGSTQRPLLADFVAEVAVGMARSPVGLGREVYLAACSVGAPA